MSDLWAFTRLLGAGWVLARNDALVPREMEPLLPARARLLGKLARLFAGRQARIGRPGERMARALEHLGPVAIKLGQVLATRADIFGRDFAEDLGRLRDRLAPFPTAAARAEVERSLGRPLESLYASFEEPVAAASLAQAHPAILLDGRRVAVKVLRPRIERRILDDIDALALAARFTGKLGPAARRLEPEALAATVARSLQLELDLRFEAAGASELAEVMARDGYMQAPEVIWPGVGKRVLTLTWAEGLPLSDPLALDQPGLNRKILADNLIRAFLAQALDHGVFHADLHEGNLFVAAPSRLTAVDFGIIGRLGRRERRYLAEILYGFLERDYHKVAQSHFDAGYVPAHHSVDSFAQALRAVGEPIFGHTAQDVSMGVVLAQLFEITALFDMRLRPELVLLQKTMMVTEGVARRLDPEHDIWKAADPVVRRYILRELHPAARLRQLADEGLRAVEGLVRRAEAPAVAAVHEIEREEQRLASRFTWFAVGVAIAALAFVGYQLIHH